MMTMMEGSNASFQNAMQNDAIHQGQMDKADNMDITITTAPPDSPEMDSVESLPSGELINASMSGNLVMGGSGIAQPKVQTAFIHKLYSMLEDASIQHLISWSLSNESFIVTPSGEFSKVLSQYFKHTNISSFVRQLNMYGFHKVNDVFHSSAPDSAVWEFKHGNGNFKRGDLVGLREIKRRASRHTLTTKDSFSANVRSGPMTAPGTPNEQVQDNSVEARLFGLEQQLWDMSQRMARMEELNNLLGNRCRTMLDGLTRCHQWTIDLSQFIDNIVPQPDAPVHRELQSLRKEIERHTQGLEEAQEQPMRERPMFMPTVNLDNSALSPRQRPIDDDGGRRPPPALRAGYVRPGVPSHLSLGPRRLSAVSLSSSALPNSLHPTNIPPAAERPQPRNLTSLQAPPNHLSRRHTSADIRLQGWNPPGNSPFSQSTTVQWGGSTSSRSRQNKEINKTSQMLANYEIKQGTSPNSKSQYSTPSHHTPPYMDTAASMPESTWSFATATRPIADSSKLDPLPPPMGSRRSSVVPSSVHALLNPSSGGENGIQPGTNHSNNSDGDSDCEPIPEDRKRKRAT